MRASKKAMLAAGLLAGMAAMTGCTADMRPVATPTPQAAQQTTAQPATAQPEMTDAAQEPAGEETPSERTLLVGGEEASAGAALENGRLLLPLEETARLLGWEPQSEQTQEETQTKRVVTLSKDDSRITVSWTVSDNTARQITWQKDGLLIPVDTYITTIGDVVYVPAAFFEEGMDAQVTEMKTDVIVSYPMPSDTPETDVQSSGENG